MSQLWGMMRLTCPYGRPVVVMSVACPPAENKSDKRQIKYVEKTCVLPDQESCVPTDQSLPSRPKASKFQVVSKATHGDAFTAAEAERSKREATVGTNISTFQKLPQRNGCETLGYYGPSCDLILDYVITALHWRTRPCCRWAIASSAGTYVQSECESAM